MAAQSSLNSNAGEDALADSEAIPKIKESINTIDQLLFMSEGLDVLHKDNRSCRLCTLSAVCLAYPMNIDTYSEYVRMDSHV